MSVIRFIVAGLKSVQFVSEHHYTTTGVNLDISFAGAQAGDLALLFGISEGSITGLTGWSHLTTQSWSASQNDAWSKTLSSADISAGKVTVSGTSNGGIFAIAFYRGPTTASVVSSAVSSATSLSIPGFTKALRSLAVLTWVGNGAGSGGTIAAPSGTAARVAPFGSSVLSGALADILPAASYVNGTALTWTGLNAGTNNAGGMILELT